MTLRMQPRLPIGQPTAVTTMVFGAAMFLALAGAGVPHAAAQPGGPWSDAAEASITYRGPRLILPQVYRTVRLDVAGMRQQLDQAPPEGAVHARSSSQEVDLPLPDGSWSRFRVVASPIMEPGLAAKFPEIRTYAGVGVDDRTATLRMDITPVGFHAIILSVDGAVYIDPYQQGDVEHYISYRKLDFIPGVAVAEESPRVVDSPAHREKARLLASGFQATTGSELRTYRIAVAATGEYTQFHGGTVVTGQAAIVTAINRVTAVYEREVSLRMTLVANNDQLVFTNPSTDPYSNNDPNALLTQNQTQCDNIIGNANYDIGHVFGTGGGGLALLGVTCVTGLKAQGETGSASPTGDPFWIDFVAHEIGHQWGGNHTFNGTSGNCSGGTRNPGTAYEPGSGSTIQGYAGICPPQDLQSNSDDYFHTASFDEFEAHIATIAGCATTTPTGNAAPIPNAGAGGFTIPISTPFELTGSATDPNSDPITYCWEQFDLGPAGAPGSPSGDAPIFRSFPPVPGPTRVFPKLSDLLNNTTTIGEILPTYARNLTFRLTARDNLGGVAHDQMAFSVSDAAGPFLVTAPNTAVTWMGGTTQTVTWNVANTNQAPVNAANVDILLSVNGGVDYTFTLASATPNDGSQMIVVPNAATTQARIKVKASGNVFFDISNQDFTITAGGPACEISDLAPGAQTDCVAGFNTYTQEVTVTYSNPPGSGTLDVNGQTFAITTSPQTVVLTNLFANGGQVDVTASFSAEPACSRTENALFTAPTSCGSACLITDLTAGVQTPCDAGTYSQQVIVTFMTPPATGTLIVNGMSFPILTSPRTVELTGLPADGQPVNVTASFSDNPSCTATQNALFTAPAACSVEWCMPENPIDIPDDDPDGVISIIDFPDSIVIQEVHVFVDIEHTYISDLIVELEHNGTTVRLHDESGGSGVDILGTYPTTLTVDGPGTLGDFNGMTSNGNWTFFVSDNVALDVGTLWDWCVEIIGTRVATDVGPQQDQIPVVARLFPSHPNPAPNGLAQISFALGRPEAVSLRIYDVAGRLVRTLHQGRLGVGGHGVQWDGKDNRGERVNAGIYFYQLQAGSTLLSKKLTVIR